MILRVILLAVTCTCFLCAQEISKSAQSQPSSTANNPPSVADTQNVSPEMQSLIKAIAGRWSTTIKPETSEMTPNAGTGKGEEIWRPGPGGFTLLEEEHHQTLYGDRFLLALQWWDNSTNSFHGMLCNNSGPAGCNVESTKGVLKWDGKQYVIDMEFPSEGKRMLWHEVFTDFTPTSFTQTGDVGEVGGPLKRSISIRATKIGDVRSEFSQ